MAKAVAYVPYTGPIVTRAEAKVAGAKRYFTGKPCKHGHISERYTTKGCVACVSATATVWRAENRKRFDAVARDWQKTRREYVAAKQNEWRLANLERRRLTNKAWRQDNSERQKALKKAWLAANALRTRCYTENRRARKQANGGSHTPEQIKELHAKQRHRCAGCRVSIRNHYEVDHIIPVSRGGTNDISNIQLLCMPCNRSKHTKSAEQWARERGCLL
jgi:5-methylcytosine-specific restriction endonuclease McrA